MWKKCEVVMLPTNQKATINMLLLYYNNLTVVSKEQSHVETLLKAGYIPQHLYILSDDEIKEGDWFMSLFNGYPLQNVKGGFKEYPDTSKCKKIIASTDSSLLIESDEKFSKHIIASIPESFIKHYVYEFNKGNKIEKAMVEYETVWTENTDRNIPTKSDLFIVLKVYKINSDNTISIKFIKNNWTREEVEMLLLTLHRDTLKWINEFIKNNSISDFDVSEWIGNNL